MVAAKIGLPMAMGEALLPLSAIQCTLHVFGHDHEANPDQHSSINPVAINCPGVYFLKANSSVQLT